MSEHEENLCTVWEDFPNPRSMDRYDLLEALDNINPLTYNEGEREIFGDWYRQIPEDVRDDAALTMPHKVMAAEVMCFVDLKGVHRRVVRRSAEYRHQAREIKALQKENERLRGVIMHNALWEKNKEETTNVGNDRAAD